MPLAAFTLYNSHSLYLLQLTLYNSNTHSMYLLAAFTPYNSYRYRYSTTIPRVLALVGIANTLDLTGRVLPRLQVPVLYHNTSITRPVHLPPRPGGDSQHPGPDRQGATQLQVPAVLRIRIILIRIRIQDVKKFVTDPDPDPG